MWLAGAWGGCTQAIEFDDAVAPPYVFVDGGVDIGAPTQEIRVGQTTGAGREGVAVVAGVSVRLAELESGREVACGDQGEGVFACGLAGAYGRTYRLTIDLPGAGAYTATTGPLAEADLGLAAAAGLEVVRRPDGETLETAAAIIDLHYDVPAGPAGVLLVRTGLSWAYTDLAAGGLDPALTCYFDEGLTGGYVIADLGARAAGARALVRVGRFPLDFRTATASVVSVEATRVPVAARRYYRDLSVALALGGSIFSERPYSTIGNAIAPAGGPAMLGYFAVRDRETLRVPLTSREIKARTPPPLCRSLDAAPPPDIDCVNCLAVNPALFGEVSLRPPPWWP